MKAIKHNSLLSLLVMASLASSLALTARAHDVNDMHTGPAMGGMHHERMHEKKKEMMDEFYDKIDATPQQRQQFEAMHKQFEDQTKPLTDNLWTKRSDLMSYMAKPDSSQDEAIRREGEIVDMESQLGRMRIQHEYQAKALLSPVQQQKASAFFQEMQEKWQDKKEDRMHSGMTHGNGVSSESSVHTETMHSESTTTTDK